MPRQRATYDPVPPWWYPTPDPPSTPEPSEPDPVPNSRPTSTEIDDTTASHPQCAVELNLGSPTELLSEIAAEPPRASACAEPATLAEPPRADIGEADAPAASAALTVTSPGWISDPAVTQLAVRWAIDFCSWDEDNPSRRDTALGRYLTQPTPIRGWSGRGRQRATFAVAGPTRLDEIDLDITWVAVEALVTPYEPRPVRALSESSQRAAEASSRTRLSSAPSPEASGWRPLDSVWMQVIVAVRRLPTGQLVIDPDLDPALLDELDDTPDDLPLADQAL